MCIHNIPLKRPLRRRRRVKALIEPKKCFGKSSTGRSLAKPGMREKGRFAKRSETPFGLLCIQHLYIGFHTFQPPLYVSNKMDGMDFSEKIMSTSSKAYLLLKLL